MADVEHMPVTVAPAPARPAVALGQSGRCARATASSAVGFTLDFYDLYVAGFVAPAIARVFFPGHNKALSLAGAFGALAATLLMRPLGASLLGSLADRRGRRRAMVIALL